jgi:hypothetical protein
MYCPVISFQVLRKAVSPNSDETAGEENPEKTFVFIDGGRTIWQPHA